MKTSRGIKTLIGYALRLFGFCLLAFATPLLVVPFVMLIGVYLFIGGVRVALKGRLIMQVDAETLLKEDSRQLVLYLRDFRNADADSSSFRGIITTEEERLAMVMNQVGPFVALGEPKHKGTTDFGAARFYLGDDWQDKVKELLGQAKLVVIRIDPIKEKWGYFYRDTHQHDLGQKKIFKLEEKIRPADFIPRNVGYWVWWELAQIKTTNKLDRTLLYLPFKAKASDREEIYQDVRGFIKESLEQELPARLGRARFIGFKTDGSAYLISHKAPPTLGIVNFYGTTLKPFFKQVGVNSVSGITIHYFRIVEVLFGLITVLAASYLAVNIWGLFILLVIESFRS